MPMGKSTRRRRVGTAIDGSKAVVCEGWHVMSRWYGKKAQAKKCDAMAGITEEGASVIEDTDEGTATRDVALVMAGQKAEHYEIATYGGLTFRPLDRRPFAAYKCLAFFKPVAMATPSLTPFNNNSLAISVALFRISTGWFL